MCDLKYLALLSALFTSCLAVDKPTCKRSDYGGAVAGLLKKLPGLQQQQQLNQLASAVEGAIADCMFVTPTVRNFEIQAQDNLYICAADGSSNLGSLKRKNDVTFKDNADGSLDVTVPFVFSQKVRITLDHLAASSKSNPSGPDVKATVTITYGESWVNLVYNTFKSAELSQLVTGGECILELKDCKAIFSSPSVEIKTENGLTDAALEKLMQPFILTKLREFLNMKVKTYIFQALYTSGKWVCPEVKVKDIVGNNYDAMFNKPASSKFNTLCPALV